MPNAVIRDSLAFERFRRVDIRAHQQTMHALIVQRRDHDDVDTLEDRIDHRPAAGRGKLNIAGKQRIDAARRAAADKNRFDFEAMFLEKAALFSDPDRAVGRAECAHADANFIEGENWIATKDE